MKTLATLQSMSSEIWKARNAYREAIAENLQETGELKLLADDYDKDSGYPEGVLLSVPDKHFNLVDCVYNAIKATEKGGIEVHICYFDDKEEEGWQSANELSFDDFDILADAIQWPKNIANGEHGDTLYSDWDKAFSKARREPKDYRVIVETNELEEETGDGDRYFMIDRWEPLSETMFERWHVIRCDCAASPYDTRTAKAYTVGTQAQPSCEASPENVTRWARKMIDAGRVTDIYAERY